MLLPEKRSFGEEDVRKQTIYWWEWKWCNTVINTSDPNEVEDGHITQSDGSTSRYLPWTDIWAEGNVHVSPLHFV